MGKPKLAYWDIRGVSKMHDSHAYFTIKFNTAFATMKLFYFRKEGNIVHDILLLLEFVKLTIK